MILFVFFLIFLAILYSHKHATGNLRECKCVGGQELNRTCLSIYHGIGSVCERGADLHISKQVAQILCTYSSSSTWHNSTHCKSLAIF